MQSAGNPHPDWVPGRLIRPGIAPFVRCYFFMNIDSASSTMLWLAGIWPFGVT